MRVDYPEGIEDPEQQLNWSLNQWRENIQRLLEEAEYLEEADSIDPTMLNAATDAIEAHPKKRETYGNKQSSWECSKADKWIVDLTRQAVEREKRQRTVA